MAVRRLIVLRHAKAETYNLTDFARRLTDRGRRDASAFGLHLATHGWLPDHAYVSSAERTKQTWSAVAASSGSVALVEHDRSLYDRGVDGALEILRLAASDVETVIVVGHNPTVAYLAYDLCDEASDPASVAALSASYPTCAGATFSVECAWADLAPGRGTLVDFHVGRG